MSVTVHHGDSREVLKGLADASIDSVVCDPPYALVSIGKRFGAEGAAPAKSGKTGAYARASAGFMGQKWDTGETAFDPAFWAEVLRVLKPGAHLVAFGGTRTYHRLVCAIEDAGFEIRDQIAWLYGAGFPKSHALDRQRGVLICGCDDEAESTTERELRPVQCSDVSAAIHASDQCREVLQPGLPEQGAPGAMLRPEPVQGREGRGERCVEGRRHASAKARQLCDGALRPLSAGLAADGAEGRLHHGASVGDGSLGGALPDARGNGAPPGSHAAEQRPDQSGTMAGQSESQAGGAWPLCGGCGKPRVTRGLGTALKPALEPIVLARKPLAGTVAANVLAHGTGALNIDGCRIGYDQNDTNPATNPLYRKQAGYANGNAADSGSSSYSLKDGSGERNPSTLGRWPANVIHDGSEEVVGAFPESAGQQGVVTGKEPSSPFANVYGDMPNRNGVAIPRGDTGSAARFFYSAKADAADRCGSKHPTVKPIDLMAYLCRLVTPPGGTVLDPFAGSGSTGMACLREGFDCILIEREAQYVADIHRRIAHVAGQDAPLFAGSAA